MGREDQFFEISTSNEAYTVAAKTRNDFFDGELRVEPPVTPNAEYLEVLGDGHGAVFGRVLVGSAATLINFSFPEVEEENPAYRQRLEAVTDELLEDLTKLSDAEEFKTIY